MNGTPKSVILIFGENRGLSNERLPHLLRLKHITFWGTSVWYPTCMMTCSDVSHWAIATKFGTGIGFWQVQACDKFHYTSSTVTLFSGGGEEFTNPTPPHPPPTPPPPTPVTEAKKSPAEIRLISLYILLGNNLQGYRAFTRNRKRPSPVKKPCLSGECSSS